MSDPLANLTFYEAATNGCERTTIPDPSSLPIPNDIPYVIIPTTNITNSTPKVEICCSDINGTFYMLKPCWLWCRLSSELPKEDRDVAAQTFRQCLRLEELDYSESSASLYHSMASKRAVSWLGYVVFALAMTAALAH
jgi:hypothetical protein